MPILRSRAGTCTPSAGAETSRPPMLMRPAVGCSRPATQRSVVVLPQPEGPSSTTISPARYVEAHAVHRRPAGGELLAQIADVERGMRIAPSYRAAWGRAYVYWR